MQNVHRDFVLGVLSEEELGQQIHIHELYREYAACVQTLRAFDAVSRDILQVCPCAPYASNVKLQHPDRALASLYNS